MKLRSIVAGAVAATSLAAPAMATPQGQFPDVQPTNWAYQAILNLKERYGCAEGFPDGTFRPGEPATRALESGQQSELRAAMSDIANTVEYLLGN